MKHITETRARVIDVLETGQKLTALQIGVVACSCDPRGHIRALRKMGYNILDEWRNNKSSGRHKVYFLDLANPKTK